MGRDYCEWRRLPWSSWWLYNACVADKYGVEVANKIDAECPPCMANTLRQAKPHEVKGAEQEVDGGT